MTEIEHKALALVNEVFVESGQSACPSYNQLPWHTAKALCRAIQQHEAFRQEVSDAIDSSVLTPEMEAHLSRFILPKPDPLVEAVNEAWGWRGPHPDVTENLRAAIEARGGRIVWEGE